jgi:ribonuclease T2
MRKFFMFVLIFTISLVAREEVFASKECPAFNNMKHTKNTHNIILDTSTKYTILKYHKGQALILVKGEQPAQRWVDDTCFFKVDSIKEPSVKEVTTSSDLTKHTKKYDNREISQKNLLALSWHNAFCETHRAKKECKRPLFSFSSDKYREKHFVLHGLWPQPKNKTYCKVESKVVSLDKHKQWNRLPNLDLSDEVKKDLPSIMPGFASSLHKHEWVKHGTCYGTDANRYYEDAIRLVRQVNDSKVGNFFSNHIGKRVTLQQIRAVFNRSFGVGTGKRVELKCKKGLVTELWLRLGAGSDDIGRLLKQGTPVRSRCQGGFIDKAGF